MGSQSKIIFPTPSNISLQLPWPNHIKYAIISEQICCSFAEEVALELLSQDRQKTKLCQGIHRMLMMLFCTGLA